MGKGSRVKALGQRLKTERKGLFLTPFLWNTDQTQPLLRLLKVVPKCACMCASLNPNVKLTPQSEIFNSLFTRNHTHLNYLSYGTTTMMLAPK